MRQVELVPGPLAMPMNFATQTRYRDTKALTLLEPAECLSARRGIIHAQRIRVMKLNLPTAV